MRGEGVLRGGLTFDYVVSPQCFLLHQIDQSPTFGTRKMVFKKNLVSRVGEPANGRGDPRCDDVLCGTVDVCAAPVTATHSQLTGRGGKKHYVHMHVTNKHERY